MMVSWTLQREQERGGGRQADKRAGGVIDNEAWQKEEAQEQTQKQRLYQIVICLGRKRDWFETHIKHCAKMRKGILLSVMHPYQATSCTQLSNSSMVTPAAGWFCE